MPKQINVGRYVLFSSVLSIVVGVMGLAGCLFHVQILRTVVPGLVAIAANTSVCLILLGISLWCFRGHKEGKWARAAKWLGKTAAGIAGVVGLLSLIEFLGNLNFGIDQLLFNEPGGAVLGHIRPGLMSPMTAANFILLGAAFVFPNWRTKPGLWLVTFLSLTAEISSALSLLLLMLASHAMHMHIALPTVVTLCVLSLGVAGAALNSRICALTPPAVVGETQGHVSGVFLPETQLMFMLLLGGVFPAMLSIDVSFLFGTIRHVAEPLHECLELVGSCIALTVAMLLLLRAQHKEVPLHFMWVAAALAAMGTIDAAHAITPFGVAWSWMRHGATLLGGLLFASVWIPFPAVILRRKHVFLISIVGLSMALALFVWLWPGLMPLPWGVTSYSIWAKAANLLAGLGFLAAAAFFLLRYLRRPESENLIFGCQALLFGVAGLAFGFSHLWAAAWWTWHGLRLLAYGVVLLAVYDTLLRDVTQRKRAEGALQDSEAKFRTLADLVPQLVWMCKPDGLAIYFNQRWFDYTRLNAEQSYGRNWSTPFHPEDAPAAWDAWNQAVASGDTYRVESRLRGADGSYRWFLMRGVPMRDEAGNIAQWFGTCTDIDDLKRAEEEIRRFNRELDARVQQRTAELQESELRVRHKLDSILSPLGDVGSLELADILDVPAMQSLLEQLHTISGVVTALLDLDGKILAVAGWQNICRQFHRIHPEACKNCTESDKNLSSGVPEGEFKLYKCKNHMWDVATPIIIGGKHLGNMFCGQFFFEDEPIDYEAFRAQARQYRFDEQQYMAALDQVPRLTRVQVTASMTFLAKFAKMISQLSYSTVKLARSAEQIRRVNTELIAANKELESFTYSVSHDLRAPLRHISGFSRILSDDFGSALPDEAKHYLSRIEKGTQRMGVLVDDLLNLARIGRRELTCQVCSLRPIVDEVIAELKPEYESRKIEWKIDALPFVECDPGLIKQVFQNLLANALKFTRPRDKSVIEIGEQGDGVIFVRDNGVGFSMKHADKLFGVFQRLHRAEDFEGTGVGLATVQRIVQKHGGRIWAEAELDKGATFYFRLLGSTKQPLKTKIATIGE